jgi:hypothetical protein
LANFKACQSWAISSPHADCQALAKAGNWPTEELNNCIEDKYRYRMNNNCIATCNAGAVAYPGMPSGASTFSVPAAISTLDLQKLVNAFMVPLGYTKLTEDGVLGKKTCGATRKFYPDKVPSQCSTVGFTDPVKGGTSSSTVTTVAVKVPTPTTTTSTTTSLTTASMLSSTKWLIGSSIAIALGMVGVAVAQKKGWIKK